MRQNQVDTEKARIAAHQHNGTDAKVAVHKQSQVDYRVLVGQFPDDEGHQEHQRNQTANDNEVRLEPIQVIAFIQDNLQGADTDDQAQQTDVIHRLTLGHYRSRTHLLAHDYCGKQADRYVDEEDPRPAVAVSDPAPKDRPGNRRHHRDHRQQCQGHAALGRWIDGDQQRLGHRVQRASNDPLQHAKPHQLRHRTGNATEERGQYEQQCGPDKQLHLTETSAQPAGQRQSNGVAHRERGDDPGALLDTHPQVAGYGRQGDVGNGGVEHLHEGRQRKPNSSQQQARRAK
ncbi:hypothetical protein D3C80_906760 [compost metagenome]